MNKPLILKNVNIFDGVSNELLKKKSVTVEDGKIIGIHDSIETGDNATIIELDGKILTPGFIDCHMHMLLEEVSNKETSLTTLTPGGERYPNADASVAYLGAYNCRRMLEAGFTTVMDAGGSNFIECALREALRKNYFNGPNLQIAGKQLTTNSAHFIGFSVQPFGPYGMRKAIRDLVWWGVDFIKMQLSPPIRMVGRNSQVCDFTAEEVAAAIDEAHNYSLPVHAHLRGATAIKRFLDADGDLVVHGTGIDDDCIEMMLKKNRYLLPTLLSPTPTPSPELLQAKNQSVLDLLKTTAERHWSSIEKAYKAGVKIAFSTDAGTLGIHVGTNALEFSNLTKIGMSNFEALKAATSEAACAIHKESEIGRIAVGYKADLAVLAANPLDDIAATRNVLMTIRDGAVVFTKNQD